jgi:hypothetical protein
LFGDLKAAPDIRVQTGRQQVAAMYCGPAQRSRLDGDLKDRPASAKPQSGRFSIAEFDRPMNGRRRLDSPQGMQKLPHQWHANCFVAGTIEEFVFWSTIRCLIKSRAAPLWLCPLA